MRHLLLFPLLLATLVAARAETLKFTAQPAGSKIRVDGKSNIHDWWMEGALVGGFLEVDEKFPAKAGAKPAPGKFPAKVEVRVPIRSLNTSGKAAMNSVMQGAIKMEDHPLIQFKAAELVFKEAKEGKLAFEAPGKLTVAGLTKDLTLPITLEHAEGGKLKFRGEAKVKMTDFGIKPPSPALALGLIKTDDEVKITFEWLTAPAAKQAP
jgi:polyisoprenoid-binding protein YceI